MSWRRCPGSGFYRNLEQERSEFHNEFLDPIELVFVRTFPRGDGDLSVSARRILDLDLGVIHDNLVPQSAARLEAWVRLVAQASESGPRWKENLLDNLDVDLYERDRLLESIEVLIEIPPTAVNFSGGIFPRSRSSMKEALRSLGVTSC